MTSPLDTLRQEHRDIARVLCALEDAVASEAAVAENLRSGRFAPLLRYLRVLPCSIHHPKEESLLPILAAKDLGVALEMEKHHQDHAISYALLRAIDGALARTKDAKDYARFREIVLNYVEHKRRHIAREDEVLLPLAERLLDATDLVRLKDLFDRIGGGILLPDLETIVGVTDNAGPGARRPINQMTFQPPHH